MDLSKFIDMSFVCVSHLLHLLSSSLMSPYIVKGLGSNTFLSYFILCMFYCTLLLHFLKTGLWYHMLPGAFVIFHTSFCLSSLCFPSLSFHCLMTLFCSRYSTCLLSFHLYSTTSPVKMHPAYKWWSPAS